MFVTEIHTKRKKMVKKKKIEAKEIRKKLYKTEKKGIKKNKCVIVLLHYYIEFAVNAVLLMAVVGLIGGYLIRNKNDFFL